MANWKLVRDGLEAERQVELQAVEMRSKSKEGKDAYLRHLWRDTRVQFGETEANRIEREERKKIYA